MERWKYSHDFNKTTMLSIGSLLLGEDSNFIKIWIRSFVADAKTVRRGDNKINGSENEIIDLLSEISACEVIRKISSMTYPTELERLTFNQIKEYILRKFGSKKRLFIPEQTKLLSLKQEYKEISWNFYTGDEVPAVIVSFGFKAYQPLLGI